MAAQLFTDFPEKFAERNAAYRDSTYRLIALLAWYWSLSDLLCLLQRGIVLLSGAYWVSQGALTVGTQTLSGNFTFERTGGATPVVTVTISNGGSGATYSLGTVSIFTNNVTGIGATNFDGTLNIVGVEDGGRRDRRVVGDGAKRQ